MTEENQAVTAGTIIILVASISIAAVKGCSITETNQTARFKLCMEVMRNAALCKTASR